MQTQPVITPPTVPVGKIKSFGPVGSQCEVGQPVRQLDNGEWMVEVTLVQTGEKAEYPLSHLLDDPDAR